jgi:hypothetical protein
MVVCISALILVPVEQLLISVVRTPVFNLKQVSPYIPAVAFVAAIGLVEASSLVRRLRPSWQVDAISLGAATVVAIIALRGTIHWYGEPAKEDWRTAAASVSPATKPVYVWEWFVDTAADYYLGPERRSRPLWPTLQPALADGYVPIERAHVGDESALIISHDRPGEATTLLNALQPYFSISQPTVYSNIRVYQLRVKSTASYNVRLVTDRSATGWSVTPEGYLRSASDASFIVRSGSSQAPYTLHIEYLDAGPTSFSISGISQELPSRPVALTTVPITGSGAWRTADVPIDDARQLRNAFSITAGLTVRTLELRRYDLEGASVLRGEDTSFRQWFLRPDGYLETIGPGVCIWPTVHVDATQTPTLTVEMTYLEGSAWKSIAINVPAVDELSCPIQMPERLVVQRIVVRPSS